LDPYPGGPCWSHRTGGSRRSCRPRGAHGTGRTRGPCSSLGALNSLCTGWPCRPRWSWGTRRPLRPHGSSRSLGAGSASARPRLQSHVKIVVASHNSYGPRVWVPVGIRHEDFHLMHSHAQVYAQGGELSDFHPVHGYVRPGRTRSHIQMGLLRP